MGRKCVLRANRTINVGEEILDNYGVYYLAFSKKDRQKRLKQQYFFECDCPACKKNWPTLAEIKVRFEGVNELNNDELLLVILYDFLCF